MRKGDGGRSLYAGQWNDQRLNNIHAFAKSRGRDKPTLQDQLDFVLEEGNAKSPYADQQWAAAMPAFMQAKTPEEATTLFMKSFERPNEDPNINGISKRINWASSLQDSGGTATATAIPEEGQEPAPAAAAPSPQGGGDEDQQEDQGDGTVIEVPEAQPQQEIQPDLLENDEFNQQFPRPGYQEGGAIPDDGFSGSGYLGGALQFAEGGEVDAYNPDRDYTQNVAAAPITMTPQINTTTTTPAVKPVAKPVVKPVAKKITPKVDPNLVGPGGTSPLANVAARSGYNLSMNPKYFGAAAQQGGNQNWTNPGNRYRPQQQAFYKASQYGIDSLTPQEKNLLIGAGMLRPYSAAGQNVRGATPAPALPSMRFHARGGKVADRDTRFQELLKQESRMGGGRGEGIGGQGGNARDRAARRLSQEEGRPSSTAYRPTQAAAPPRNKPKTGGTKPVPVPKSRPAEPKTGGRPSIHPPEAQTVRATPVRGFTKAGPAGPAGYFDAEGNRTDNTFRERTLAERQIGPRKPLGLDLPENLEPEPEWNEGDNVPYLPAFAKGGAIPDDTERESIADRNRRERAGYDRPRKKKTAAAPQTKSASKKKPKDTSKPQKRDQKKRTGGTQRPSRPAGDGGLPPMAPMPTARPTNTLPPTAPIPGVRPAGGPPPTAPIPGVRPAGGPPPTAPIPGVRPAAGPPSTFPGRPPGPPGGLPARTGGNPFDAALAGLRPAPATGGVMSPIPGVAAPVSPAMDVPRGGTWAPPGAGPGAGPSGRMQPNVPSQPATPQTAPPADGGGGMDLSQMSVKDLLDKLSGLTARDLAYPFPTRDATGAKQYAKGGAIPDDTPNFPAAGEAGSAASSANSGPEQGQRGYNEQVAEGRTVDYHSVAEKAGPAVKTGIDGLSRIFGFDATGQQQGVPTPEGQAQQDAGIQRFASGEGAATPEEVGAIDKVFGIDKVAADEGTKNLMRLDQTVQYYLQRGDKEKAEAVAASLLQFGASQVKRYGITAAAAFDNYQKTGDPAALQHASEAIMRAHQMVPDGLDLKIDIDPKTRQIVATTVDASGKQQKQVVDPMAIPGLLKHAMDGSEYWGAAFQIGQPRLAEQQMHDTAAAATKASDREYNREYDEYKFQRGEEAKIESEERAAERKQFEHQQLLDEGQTAGERRQRQTDQFYDDWNTRFEAAGTPEEKRQLFEEGLQYRFDATPNRQQPVADDEFGIAASQYDQFDEADIPALTNIARVVATKNGALDASGALAVVSALVTAPVVDNNPDGTLNVEGNSLVFNPQLLPQLDTLRKKYRQQGG